jgi:hypothetical protein
VPPTGRRRFPVPARGERRPRHRRYGLERGQAHSDVRAGRGLPALLSRHQRADPRPRVRASGSAGLSASNGLPFTDTGDSSRRFSAGVVRVRCDAGVRLARRQRHGGRPPPIARLRPRGMSSHDTLSGNFLLDLHGTCRRAVARARPAGLHGARVERRCGADAARSLRVGDRSHSVLLGKADCRSSSPGARARRVARPRAGDRPALRAHAGGDRCRAFGRLPGLVRTTHALQHGIPGEPPAVVETRDRRPRRNGAAPALEHPGDPGTARCGPCGRVLLARPSAADGDTALGRPPAGRRPAGSDRRARCKQGRWRTQLFPQRVLPDRGPRGAARRHRTVRRGWAHSRVDGLRARSAGGLAGRLAHSLHQADVLAQRQSAGVRVRSSSPRRGLFPLAAARLATRRGAALSLRVRHGRPLSRRVRADPGARPRLHAAAAPLGGGEPEALDLPVLSRLQRGDAASGAAWMGRPDPPSSGETAARSRSLSARAPSRSRPRR